MHEAEMIITGIYGFIAYRDVKDSRKWRCHDSDYMWTAVVDDFGFLVPVSAYVNIRGY